MGQAAGRRELVEHCVPQRGVQLLRLIASQQPLPIAGLEAQLGCTRSPFRRQIVEANELALGLAGRERRCLGRPRAGRPALGERGLDLRAPAAERPQHRLGDAHQIGDPVADRQPFKSESSGQLRAQDGLVDEARRPRVRVQPPAVQRRPAAVRAAAEVGDQHVGVELRIACSRRAMPERRCHEPSGRHDLGPAMAATDRGGGALEIADGFESGAVVRGADRAPQFAVADPEQDADALGRREGQVIAGDSYRARRTPQRRAIQRIKAGQGTPQGIAVNRAREAQRHPSRADPGAACFGAAGVVLLHAVADAVDRVHAHLALLQVVPGLAR